MSQDATGYVCLLIQPTMKDDAGWYTVAAKNDAGVVSCTCRLDIYGKRWLRSVKMSAPCVFINVGPAVASPAQWHQSVPPPMRKAQRASGRYSALTGQGLDVRSAFSTSDASPFLFASSPPEATLESEELWGRGDRNLWCVWSVPFRLKQQQITAVSTQSGIFTIPIYSHDLNEDLQSLTSRQWMFFCFSERSEWFFLKYFITGLQLCTMFLMCTQKKLIKLQ